jgi:phage N-6-adenine-methyltransferase
MTTDALKPDLRLVRTMPAQKPGKSKQDYATPWAFVRALEARFDKIELDLAATKDNAKAPLYFTPEDDSLSKDWDACDVKLAFLNPPFGSIAPWAKKCAAQERLRILFLVPASVGSNWWAQHVHGKADLVLFVRPRLSFDGKNSFPKDCAVAAYNLHEHNTRTAPLRLTRYECWNWIK